MNFYFDNRSLRALRSSAKETVRPEMCEAYQPWRLGSVFMIPVEELVTKSQDDLKTIYEQRPLKMRAGGCKMLRLSMLWLHGVEIIFARMEMVSVQCN